MAKEAVRKARPFGTAFTWDGIRTAGAMWVRRGEVLGVQAAGNHPATHAVWLEALALGYRVAIRPSRREPFTPHRLVSALRASGFGPDHVVFLPTDHSASDVLVDETDMAVLYGSDELVAAYRARANVLVQGPGRSKVLIADGRWEEHLDTVVESVSGFGATACVNASTVLTDGDTAGMAEALARRLSEIPVRSPFDEDAVLPAFPKERATALAAHLRSKLDGAELISDDDLVVNLPGGGAVLRPAVVVLERATAPQTRIELPFPCVWVAPWTPADGIAPLRDTLTLTAFTTDSDLVTRLAEETSISNLHIGEHPTYLMQPGLPHDGHLADFLMKSKTVIRDTVS
jgi:acyl-CoA reductase-like NAD-dependent aldehyde dehydrogenase